MKEIEVIYLNENTSNTYYCTDYSMVDGWVVIKNIHERITATHDRFFRDLKEDVYIRQRQIFKMYVRNV